jgi:thymidylate synthase
MHYFEADDINNAFIDVLQATKQKGKEITKQGNRIKEIYPVIIRIENPRIGILHIQNRGYNPAFSVAETLWNLTAETEDWLVRYNFKYGAYFTNGKLSAGYGNRIFNWGNRTNQIDKVVTMLRQRPESQHANIVVADPTSDLDNPKFVPCISLLKFKIRENKLEMTTLMRAQDIWLGFPYDIHLLLSIFQLVSTLVGIEMGAYYHYCDVVRLYEMNYQQAEDVFLSVAHRSTEIELDFAPDNLLENLHRYKDLIKDFPPNPLDEIEQQPEYWRNSLKVCYAYNLIKQKRIGESLRIVNSISNVYRDQFHIWLRQYHPELCALNAEAC